jgi:superfamily I DNA/RNA helicase
VERFLADVQWGCQAEIARTFARSNDPNAGRPVSSFVRLALPIKGIACKVIHQAKGETYDAVMVVCGAAAHKRRGDLEQWLSPNQSEEDERRTGYVAMTRPRKILVVAVPRGTDVSTLKEHFDLGALAPRK